ncbi:MAG: OsmC family protein [Flavobacteriales bacterium]|nr:OsmC family protein [Bacteroidota bacterium]MCB9241492.1 OsmC family protein [Flavobacteriales bacterium]
MNQHEYKVTIQWTGNKGEGTTRYDRYSRDHVISIHQKPDWPASSDVIFRGDGTKHNPEDMLLASLSSCHMLWYLHLCADAGVVVVDYTDHATGILELGTEKERFTSVVLHPVVTVRDLSMVDRATQLHHDAHKRCFIANSCNFPVSQEVRVVVAD